MQLLSDLLHYYMVSPKDAFRKVPFLIFSGIIPGQATWVLKSSIRCYGICIIKLLNLFHKLRFSNNFLSILMWGKTNNLIFNNLPKPSATTNPLHWWWARCQPLKTCRVGLKWTNNKGNQFVRKKFPNSKTLLSMKTWWSLSVGIGNSFNKKYNHSMARKKD